MFSGLRPLVTGNQANTSKLSREHHIDISATGLVTVAGGKWTTYRRMAEDTLDFTIRAGLLPNRPCVSKGVKLHGAPTVSEAQRDQGHALGQYGTEAAAVRQLALEDPALAAALDPGLPYTAAEVVYAVRHEMARTVEDVLSRRTRALLLDARAAARAAPATARLMAAELGLGQDWVGEQVTSFQALARRFYGASAGNGEEDPETRGRAEGKLVERVA